VISYKEALALCRSGIESAARLISDLSVSVDEEQRQIALLLRQVSKLELKVAKLSKNSTNSSKSPSSDITRPKHQQRQKGKRKIGAQPGHPRHERAAFSDADIQRFYDYRLDACPACGNAEVTFLDHPPRVIQQVEMETRVIRKEAHRSYPVCSESSIVARPSRRRILSTRWNVLAKRSWRSPSMTFPPIWIKMEMNRRGRR